MNPTEKEPSSPARWTGQARRGSLIATLLVLGTGFLLSWHSLTDIDIWFHLRSGRDLLAGEGMATVNRYSFTEPDHRWLNHEWLFQVGAAALGPKVPDEPLGVAGWNALRTFLVLALVLTLSWVGGLYRRSGGPAIWTGLCLMVGLLLLWPRLTLRPELVSYTCFILVVHFSEQMGRVPSLDRPIPWKSLLGGPPGKALLVILFWAQCHGFATLGPAVLVLAAILAPLEARWRSPHLGEPAPFPLRWLLALVALVALAATPNGLRGLLFPLSALGQFAGKEVDLRRTVSELVPLLRSPESLDWTIKAYLASLAWGLVWILARWRDLSLLRIVLFALAGAAAWTSQRNIGLYAVTFVLLHGAPSGRTSWMIPRFRLGDLPPRLPAIAGLVILCAACLAWWPAILSDDFYLHEGVGRRFGSGVNPARFPVEPAAGLGDAERYFANLDAAAFTLAQAPGKIFIDGRTEAYSPGLWAEYLAIKRGGDQALRMLTRRGVDAVCIATGNPAFRVLTRSLLKSDDWRLTRADGGGLLFVPGAGNPGLSPESEIVRAAITRLEIKAGAGPGPRRADFLLAASRLAGFMGDHRKGQEFLTRGLELKPGHPVLHHNLGNLLLAQELFAKAASHFETALDLNPRLAGSALNAGVCRTRLGDREAARRFFRRAVRIDPRHFEAWMNLAVTNLALGDQEAARRAAARARELRPNDRGVRDLQRRLGS